MKEFLVIKNYKVMSPVVDASFEDEDKARQYAELCKLRDGGEYRVAKLIQVIGSGVMPLSLIITTMKQVHLICLLMIAAQNGFSTIEETLDYIYTVHCIGDIREWLQYKYNELFNLYQLGEYVGPLGEKYFDNGVRHELDQSFKLA